MGNLHDTRLPRRCNGTHAAVIVSTKTELLRDAIEREISRRIPAMDPNVNVKLLIARCEARRFLMYDYILKRHATLRPLSPFLSLSLTLSLSLSVSAATLSALIHHYSFIVVRFFFPGQIAASAKNGVCRGLNFFFKFFGYSTVFSCSRTVSATFRKCWRNFGRTFGVRWQLVHLRKEKFGPPEVYKISPSSSRR